MDDERPADPAPTTETPGAGAVLAGRYALGALLGSGGMGRVFSARDRKLQREVAIKLLTSTAPEEDSLRRFEREAMAAGALQHPNVVAVFDVGDEAGHPFIVTELLKGVTLRERLKAGPLPLGEALRLARQIAAGLAAAHEKGFTHRDLKPENLFLTDDGWVKILDFGLVKLTEELRPTRLEIEPASDDVAVSTAAGRMMGTVGYMAPEQVRGRPVDSRADLFNFGAVLYEMLCGARAFRGGSPTETGYAILAREPDPLPSKVPRKVRELVRRCLEKDREQRPASARQVLAALDLIEQKPGANTLALRLPSLHPRLPLVLGALLAAGALVVAGLRLRSAPVLPAAGKAPSGTVAILPFSARDAPAFGYLAEGIVDLLARDLQGSELRPVDSASVVRALGGDTTANVDKVRGASAQLGAKYFILGRVEQRRDQLVLDAVLHTAAGEPVSQAVARGEPGEVLRLVRKLSDQLQLRSPTTQEFETRLAKLTLRTSRSPQALQAWLEGERLLRRGHGEGEMIGAFQRAVVADPEFALAHYRLGMVASMLEPGLAEDALQRALSYGNRLAPQERGLVEARLAVQQGRFAEAERLLLGLTRQNSDDAEAWGQLGELYFHQNTLRGRSPQESMGPFQHALVIDPLNTEAVSHLTDLALLRGDRALVARLADRLLAFSDDQAMTLASRQALVWARGDVSEHAAVMASLREPGLARALIVQSFLRAAWQLDDGKDAAQMAALLVNSEAASERGNGHQFLGVVELMRGRPAAARAEFAKAATENPNGYPAYRAAWFEAQDLVPPDAGQLAAARAAAARLGSTTQVNLVAERPYLIGALAARAGDFPAAEAAAHELERMAPIESSSITGDLALAVRARVLAARGEHAASLAMLDKQELRVPARYAPFHWRISESWLRASLLESLGRPGEALPLYDAFNFYNTIDPAFAPLAQLRKARLLETLGDTEGAIAHYARFVDLWKDCEPSQKPELERAKARLEKLREPTAVRAAR